MDPSSHAHLVDEHIRKVVREAFPKGAAAARKPYVTGATLELVSAKNGAVKSLHYYSRRCKLAVAKFALRHWINVIACRRGAAESCKCKWRAIPWH
eukprot:6117893-Karenia_brevis.AAC.1